MKIGILTFHRAYNYGAQLQVFALCKTLEKLGNKPEVINYQPNYLIKPYRLFKYVIYRGFTIRSLLSMVKQFIITLITAGDWYTKHRKFRKFHKTYLSLSKKSYSQVTDFPKNLNYDLVITGSDQVWNNEITNRDETFFLNLMCMGNIKKASYAASFSSDLVTQKDYKWMAERINKINKISVREHSLKKELLPHIKNPISVVLDPTLLFTKSDWEKWAIPPKIKSKYLLCYRARGSKESLQPIVLKLAREKNLQIIDLSQVGYQWFNGSYQGICPLEFVGLIKHAECIVSVSFHGTALSVILEKDFYSVMLDDGRDGRVKDLLILLKLESRLIKIDSEISFTKVEDYNVPNKLLTIERQKSLMFLQNITK